MSDKVRLGIIGLGAQGSMYAKFIADGMVPNMNIGGLSDHDPAKAERVGALYPGVPFYADYLAMLDSGDVDAVVTAAVVADVDVEARTRRRPGPPSPSLDVLSRTARSSRSSRSTSSLSPSRSTRLSTTSCLRSRTRS